MPYLSVKELPSDVAVLCLCPICHTPVFKHSVVGCGWQALKFAISRKLGNMPPILSWTSQIGPRTFKHGHFWVGPLKLDLVSLSMGTRWKFLRVDRKLQNVRMKGNTISIFIYENKRQKSIQKKRKQDHWYLTLDPLELHTTDFGLTSTHK